ncbi:hypothetical protein WJX77_009794 [Trebouxia sp. C0004]
MFTGRGKVLNSRWIRPILSGLSVISLFRSLPSSENPTSPSQLADGCSQVVDVALRVQHLCKGDSMCQRLLGAQARLGAKEALHRQYRILCQLYVAVQLRCKSYLLKLSHASSH